LKIRWVANLMGKMPPSNIWSSPTVQLLWPTSSKSKMTKRMGGMRPSSTPTAETSSLWPTLLHTPPYVSFCSFFFFGWRKY
jgi:hypothetical protein